MKEWITGRNPVFEVLRTTRRDIFRVWVASGVKPQGRLQEILQLARQQKRRVEEVPRQKLDLLHPNHQGVGIEVSGYPYADLDDILDKSYTLLERPFILALDQLQDPQNLGTLLRTAEIMQVHGILLPSAHAAQVTPAVVSASSGASEHLLIAQINLVQAFERLKAVDCWVVGLEGSEQAQYPEALDLNRGLVLVTGSEGEGLRQLVRKNCDYLMRLPMLGKIESLNAAVAGSIAIYLARQARNT